MSKKAIAIEGATFRDGRMLEEDAVFLTKKTVPVVTSTEFEKIVGVAGNLERQSVSAGMVVFAEIELLEQYQEQIDLNEFDASLSGRIVESSDDLSIISKIELGAIILTRHFRRTT